MPIVECPNCQTKLDIPAKYAGQTGKCNKCGEKIHVPSGFQPDEPTQSHASSGNACTASYDNKEKLSPKGKRDLVKVAVILIPILAILYIIGSRQDGNVAQQNQREEFARQIPSESDIVIESEPEQRTESYQENVDREGVEQQHEQGDRALSTEERNAVASALAEEGLPPYISLEIKDTGWVVAKFELTPDYIANRAFATNTTVENFLERFANNAVLTIRNALYPFDVSEDYRVVLHGPSPGPGLVRIYGTARFSGRGVDWRLEGL